MQNKNRPEFLGFSSNRARSEQTAFVLFNRFENGNLCCPEVLDLMEKHIQAHLYFFLNGLNSKVHRHSASLNTFDSLERNGYKYVICLEPGYFIRSSDEAQILLNTSIINPNIDVIGFEESDFRIKLIRLAPAKGKSFDHFFSQHPFHSLENQHPSLRLAKEQKTTAQYFDFSKLTSDQTHLILKKQFDELHNHFQNGFTSTFVFNTETYSDINFAFHPIDKIQFIGLASGFKLNYLADQYRANCSEILFVDSNQNSIELKKMMFEKWDGLNFPSWFFSNWNQEYKIYESNRDFFEACWRRELSIWGGEVQFKNHWDWFRTQNVVFKEIDLVSDVDQLVSHIKPNSPVFFWNSNVWNNEYVNYALGGSVFPSYLAWVQKLTNRNPNIFMIQDHIFHENKKIKLSGRPVYEILKAHAL